MCAALAGLDFQSAAFHPIREYDAKRIIVRLADGPLLLSAMRLWIDALGQQATRFYCRNQDRLGTGKRRACRVSPL
jgi:hypothetical protein